MFVCADGAEGFLVSASGLMDLSSVLRGPQRARLRAVGTQTVTAASWPRSPSTARRPTSFVAPVFAECGGCAS